MLTACSFEGCGRWYYFYSPLMCYCIMFSLKVYCLKTVKKDAHLPCFVWWTQGWVGKTPSFKNTVGRRELFTNPLVCICSLLVLSVLKFVVLASFRSALCLKFFLGKKIIWLRIPLKGLISSKKTKKGAKMIGVLWEIITID